MKIGAYQFAVTHDVNRNLLTIKNAVLHAARERVELLALPECALTGYPPRDLEIPAAVDFEALDQAYEELQALADESSIHIIAGTITKEADAYFNTVVVFMPRHERVLYHKRALWGWDADNFRAGEQCGVFEIGGLRIGVRICFEVRFPEYFRELYRAHTDLNMILFYDVSDQDDRDRYDLIKAHIRTRAVENVCYTLTVDAIGPYQTAPTALFDRSGLLLAELERNAEGLLVYELDKDELSFGEQGRKRISDFLTGSRPAEAL